MTFSTDQRDMWKARALRAEAAGEHADVLLAKAEACALKAEADAKGWQEMHDRAAKSRDDNLAARLKAEDEAHYANGVADLAMKHRNKAEEALRIAEGYVARLYENLRLASNDPALQHVANDLAQIRAALNKPEEK